MIFFVGAIVISLAWKHGSGERVEMSSVAIVTQGLPAY